MAMRKKSYMNKSNLINEGILDKIFDFIKRGKLSKLQKAFRKHPEIQNFVNEWEQLYVTDNVFKFTSLEAKFNLS